VSDASDNGYCRACGARLARDNAEGRCGPCQHAGRDRRYAPPTVPAEFWEDPGLQAAFTVRHMGRVIRAYRYHEYHGRRPLSPETVAAWCGITQPQVSKLESGTPPVYLDRLIHWARLLRIPERYLWFKLPAGTDEPVLDRFHPSLFRVRSRFHMRCQGCRTDS
jgi:hypothetical protein